ncbi:HTH domain protein [Mammaliicoccus lentus]|nr:HTH domain protein [Mammaliicoccus lentus]
MQNQATFYNLIKKTDLYRVLNDERQPIFGTAKKREAETYFLRKTQSLFV